MKYQYELRGLTCANCAAKIEAGVLKISGVASAFINLAGGDSAVLSLESDDETGVMTGEILRIVHKYEPGVKVAAAAAAAATAAAGEESPRGPHNPPSGGRGVIIRLAAGGSVFAAGLIFLLFNRIPAATLISAALTIAAYLILGYDVLLRAAKNIARGRIFDENFLMGAATIGAAALGEFHEAAAVMLFYQIGEFFQNAAVRKSRGSIAELMDIRPDYANLVGGGGEIIRVSPGEVTPGSLIRVKPGERVPLDGIVTDGAGLIDTSSLTGEPAPREVGPGGEILSGCVNLNGLLTVRVSREYGESTVARIIRLAGEAGSRKAPAERFITAFSRRYTPAVVLIAAAIALVPPLILGGWREWVGRSLIFLVVSCPCALVISIPLGYFGGIGRASRNGILIKNGACLDALTRLETAVFDKTGTLTAGVFEVDEIIPADGFTAGRLIELAGQAELSSTHPAAVPIREEYARRFSKTCAGSLKTAGSPQNCASYHDETAACSAFTETAGRGVSVTIGGVRVLAGNARLMEDNGIDFTEHSGTGTKVYVAADGIFAGCITVRDSLRADSRAAVAGLRNAGIERIVMLTGDGAAAAKAEADRLGITEYRAGLLPHEKVAALEEIGARKRAGSTVSFMGDGINDAPALAIADIGITLGGLGSDAALEAADVVIMTDEPSKLIRAIKIAMATRRIVTQNIVIALSVKIAVMILGTLGHASMWNAVFADVGVSLLAVGNSLRLLKRK